MKKKGRGTELDAFPDVDNSLSGVAMRRCASHIPMCHRKAKGQGPATCGAKKQSPNLILQKESL